MGPEWDCAGVLVPPTGYQQESAFEDRHAAPNALEGAAEKAAKKLVQRLCTSNVDCAGLAGLVKSWKTGWNANVACAMAVISDAELSAWREKGQSLNLLDTSLSKAADQLLSSAPTAPRITVDRINDCGIPGGQRADWLRARMEQFVQKRGTLADPPKGWAGEGVPKGFDVVIRCDIVPRAELGGRVLESVWSAVDRTGRKTRSAPVVFPETASPQIVGKVPDIAISESPGISVRMDAQRGGSLCAGDRTQVWIRSEEPMHVRVFNLFGDEDALVMYPNEDEPRSSVPARQTIPLGGQFGFEAVPVPGHDEERFLVLAARDEAALGRFRGAKGTCRVSAELARQLHRGQGIPSGVKTAVTGYRLVSGDACPPTSRAEADKRGLVATTLQSLPVCQF